MTFLSPRPISGAAAPSFITTVQVMPALIKNAGWHVRDVDPDRNALRQSHPGECGIGYVLLKLDCGPAPMVLGYIFGPMMDESLRDFVRRPDGVDHTPDLCRLLDRGRRTVPRHRAAGAAPKARRGDAGVNGLSFATTS
jgi:hypothetical protein